MPFEKGHNKSTGRPKGTSNKATSKVRESFTSLLEDNLGQLKEDFKELEPKDRIKLFLDLSKYVIPQLKQSEIKLEGEVNISDFDISKIYDKEA
tara:strand:- start:7181 stop:7462 length:282 start_codon:yes stop_codon:yes gene_type:complete